MGALWLVDLACAEVMRQLHATGRADDAVVLVSTDNGGPRPYVKGVPGGGPNGAVNWPLRGGKHNVYEGGVRGRAFLWAGASTVLHRPNGTASAALLHLVDWFPTFLELAGLSAAALSKVPLDGVSAVAALREADAPVAANYARTPAQVASLPARQRSEQGHMRLTHIAVSYTHLTLPTICSV